MSLGPPPTLSRDFGTALVAARAWSNEQQWVCGQTSRASLSCRRFLRVDLRSFHRRRSSPRDQKGAATWGSFTFAARRALRLAESRHVINRILITPDDDPLNILL